MGESRSVELAAEERDRVTALMVELVPDDRVLLLSALELGYLAASADGLDPGERQMLAQMLERATGAAIDQASFRDHFADLDDMVASLGRRHRIARSAADFETDEDRADVVRFAALVAMGDGTLRGPEMTVLDEIGELYEWPDKRVSSIVDGVLARLGGRGEQGGAA